MNIYVRKPEELSHRLYTVDKAKTRLAAGALKPDDTAWCRGMSEWGPLAKVIPFAEQSLGIPVAPPEAPRKLFSEIGSSCFGLIMKYEDNYTRSILNLQASLKEGDHLDLGQIWLEMICVGIYAIDYAIQTSFKRSFAQEILHSFRGQLERLRITGVPDLLEMIRYRYLVYTNVINDCAGSWEAVPWMMGDAFSTICGGFGGNHKVELETIGTTLFEKIYGGAYSELRVLKSRCLPATTPVLERPVNGGKT